MTARILVGCLVVAVLLPTGCEKKKKQGTLVTAAAPATEPAPVTEPSSKPISDKNTNFRPGAGVAKNVYGAAKRTASLNDFHQLGLAIKQYETLNGKMPSKDEIIAEVRTYPNIPAAIKDEVIILTGSTNPSGLWAYEIDADRVGGIVLVAGTARRAQADEVKQLLGQK